MIPVGPLQLGVLCDSTQTQHAQPPALGAPLTHFLPRAPRGAVPRHPPRLPQHRIPAPQQTPELLQKGLRVSPTRSARPPCPPQPSPSIPAQRIP